ncbi:hypothetical protein JHK85_049191 [Glycine max]|nr:hypothetical protein JHK85_049191 [Glycine max]
MAMELKQTLLQGMSEHETTRPEVSGSDASDLSTTLSHQQMIITERELEQESDSKDRSPLTETDLQNNSPEAEFIFPEPEPGGSSTINTSL